MKPLNGKLYGSLGHLIGSRIGKTDRYITEGQSRIATIKTRDAHDIVIIQEKLDGCLPWRTKIKTDQGDIAIGKIVNQRLPVLVASYNETLNVIEYKPIIAYHKQPRTTPWIRLVYHIDGHNSLTCTSNHQIYTNNGYIAANSIRPGILVSTIADQYSIETRQIILGSLLGDASVSQPRDYNCLSWAYTQGYDHTQYFDFVCKFLSGCGNEQKPTIGGYPGSKGSRRFRAFNTPAMHRLLLDCYNNKKQITQEWLNQLNPLALAIWYCDDGSCQFPTTQHPRITLHTQGFKKSEVQQLVGMLKDRFRVDCSIHNYKGWQIDLTANGTERFFDLICSCVPACMAYKLPERYRGLTSYWDSYTPKTYKALIEVPVKRIDLDPIVHEQSNIQFDITVADNHNYFAGKILVHNSCCGVYKKDGVLHALTRSGNLCNQSAFIHHHHFEAWMYKHYNRFYNLLQEGERVVGEYLGLAHGTRYFPERVLGWEPWVAFDIMVGSKRLPYKEFERRTQGMFWTPPLISMGPPRSIDWVQYACPESLYGGGSVEGYIYRVERDESAAGGAKVDFLCKWVNPDYEAGCLLPQTSGELVWNYQLTTR